MSHRSLSVALLCCLALAGCDKTQPVSPSPVAPPAAPLAAPAAYWNANMTVLSVTGNQGACQYGVPVGQTVTGVGWGIAVHADSISLDENVRNAPTDDLPYSGTLNGLQFSATYAPAPSHFNLRCPLRAATLSGSFNSDFSRFDATETLVSGAPGAEMTVQNQWTGSRR